VVAEAVEVESCVGLVRGSINTDLTVGRTVRVVREEPLAAWQARRIPLVRVKTRI